MSTAESIDGEFIFEKVLEDEMETFTIGQLNAEIKPYLSNQKVRGYLEDMAKTQFLHRVGDNPDTYSIHGYQADSAANNLELKERKGLFQRKALDEVVQKVLDEEQLDREEAEDLIEPYFEHVERPWNLSRLGQVLDAAEDLDIIEYDLKTETYRLNT